MNTLLCCCACEGLDAEQLELGSSAELWESIAQRRQQGTITREQLEQKIRQRGKRRPVGAGQKPD